MGTRLRLTGWRRGQQGEGIPKKKERKSTPLTRQTGSAHQYTHTRDHHHHPGGPPPPPSAFSSKTKEAQLGGLTTNNTNIT